MDAATAALVGAGVGATAGLLGSSLDRWSRRRSEARAAAAEWLSAIDDLTIALGLFPPEDQQADATEGSWVSRKLGHLLDLLAEEARTVTGPWAVHWLQYVAYLPIVRRLERISDRLTATQNRYLVVAPPYIRPLFEEPVKVLQHFIKTRDTNKAAADWWAIRPQFERLIRESLRPWPIRLVYRARRRARDFPNPFHRALDQPDSDETHEEKAPH
jgi:hypothetical protein